MPHDPEIIGNNPAVGRDLQVALMHVGVEIAVAQRVVQEQRQHPRPQIRTVMPGGIQRGIVAQGRALDPAHRHDAATALRPLH